MLVYLRIVAGNHWQPDTKAYTAAEAYTKILEIKPAAAPPARFVQGIEFRSSYCPSFIQVYYAPDRKLICEEQKKGKNPKITVNGCRFIPNSKRQQKIQVLLH